MKNLSIRLAIIAILLVAFSAYIATAQKSLDLDKNGKSTIKPMNLGDIKS